MNNPILTVVKAGQPLPAASQGELVVSDETFRTWVRNGRILRHLGRHRTTRLLTERLETAGRPMLAWALRLTARGRCYILDAAGSQREVTLRLLVAWSWQIALDAITKGALISRVERTVADLEKTSRRVAAPRSPAPVMYLRTDLSFSVRAGGSVGHIAGVLNELVQQAERPILLTTAPVPTLRSDVDVHLVAVPQRYWNFRELPALALNDVFYESALSIAIDRHVGVVYQRYSLNNYAGLRLARQLNLPFVVEYNGSEIWMSRHWSRPLKYEAIAERIELLNVRGADLVVVVSQPMCEELVARGVPSARILVNPNAVDPDRYRPDLNGSIVRQRHVLGSGVVIGFISTFQPWHGADVLARAFVRLMRDRPYLQDSVRLMMIGSGPAMETTMHIIEAAALDGFVACPGLVDQQNGPEYLAACDILVSPHVPNADGSPFFGSPTKLFEYMAMGKAIVASHLDQIGEVLRDGETALLVRPNDPGALAAALARLIDDPALRRRLGDAARHEALAHHTWRAHVRRTLDALDAVHASVA